MDHDAEGVETVVDITMLAMEEELPIGTLITITIRVPREVKGPMVNFQNYVASNDGDPEELVRLITESTAARRPGKEDPVAL